MYTWLVGSIVENIARLPVVFKKTSGRAGQMRKYKVVRRSGVKYSIG